MRSASNDSYVVMALCIAVVAIIANVVQSIDFVDTAPSAVQKFSTIARGILGQTSLALAMVAAVLTGRQMLSPKMQQPAVEPLADTQ